MRYSSGEMKIWLRDAAALMRIGLTGLFCGSVAKRVEVHRILLCRRKWAGMRPDSTSIAVVAVVRKLPKIAFIAVRWADSSLASWGGHKDCPYFAGLCQIIAA